MEARLAELRQISGRRDQEIASFTERMDAAVAENTELAETITSNSAKAGELEQLLDSKSSSVVGCTKPLSLVRRSSRIYAMSAPRLLSKKDVKKSHRPRSVYA